MKKHFIALLAIFSLGQMSFISPVSAQNPRVTIPDFADLVERASPAVVNIRTTEKVMTQQSQGGIPGMPEDQAEFFRRFFGQYGRQMVDSLQIDILAGPRHLDEGYGQRSDPIIDANGVVIAIRIATDIADD